MRTRVTFVAFSIAALVGAASAGAQTYNQVWSDEFNSAPSGSNWTFETGGGGWGNNELEYYQQANATVSNSILTIQARHESVGGMAYTSSRMNTAGHHDWTFGKIEARIQGPNGQGYWPAFWMLGSNIATVPWPGCGEIDIMEHINSVNTAYGTIHWDSGGHASYTGSTPTADFTQWHTYGIVWDTNAITWTVDGASTGAANIANAINGTEEFQKPFFIILNFAVGGSWPGNPDGSTVFPANFNVDYIRVSQLGAATATPTRAATATATATTGATATPTATPNGGSGCWAAWNAATAYTGGAQVSRTCSGSNQNFQAAFWTQGNDPCTNQNVGGNGLPWYPKGACGGATATATATRTSTPTATRTATATATTGSTATATTGATATRTATATATRTATAAATPTTGGACAGIPAFATCTAYANGASVTFGGSKYHTIAPIPNNRDCPPNSPYNPSTDNWWVNDGGC